MLFIPGISQESGGYWIGTTEYPWYDIGVQSGAVINFGKEDYNVEFFY